MPWNDKYIFVIKVNNLKLGKLKFYLRLKKKTDYKLHVFIIVCSRDSIPISGCQPLVLDIKCSIPYCFGKYILLVYCYRWHNWGPTLLIVKNINFETKSNKNQSLLRKRWKGNCSQRKIFLVWNTFFYAY